MEHKGVRCVANKATPRNTPCGDLYGGKWVIIRIIIVMIIIRIFSHSFLEETLSLVDCLEFRGFAVLVTLGTAGCRRCIFLVSPSLARLHHHSLQGGLNSLLVRWPCLMMMMMMCVCVCVCVVSEMDVLIFASHGASHSSLRHILQRLELQTELRQLFYCQTKNLERSWSDIGDDL